MHINTYMHIYTHTYIYTHTHIHIYTYTYIYTHTYTVHPRLSVPRKSKRIVLSVDDKLKICEMVQKKILKTEIMLKYNIGKSTVNYIGKSPETLKNFKMSKCELGIAKCIKATKSMKGGMFDKLDSALYLWVQQQREKGIPITAPILLEKVSEFQSYLC